MTRHYLDNAATTFPKPPGVVEAVTAFLTQIGASAGRGAYREAVEAGRQLDAARHAVRGLLGAARDDHVIFTLNGTDALNMAIKGLVRPGCHVATTVMDHNSVLRPLNALAERGLIDWTATPADPASTRLDPKTFAAALRPQTRLAVVTHASNVTGAVQPIAEIAEICRARGIRLVVDGAQTAGHLPLQFAGSGIDLLAIPGHKGLLGPLGVGVLLIRAEVADELLTYREGGTGSASEQPVQPPMLPDRFEAGSHNAVGIAGLLPAVQWIAARGVEALRRHELELCECFEQKLSRVRRLTWSGPRRTMDRVGVYSVRVAGLEPETVSTILETTFGVLTRSGLHCAPLAHQTIGTLADGGTTRISFSALTTRADVEAAGAALAEIAEGVVLPDPMPARA